MQEASTFVGLDAHKNTISVALLRPGADIRTLITADVYGSGACDTLVGRALAGLGEAA